MIAYLKGSALVKKDYLLILVGGVGYRVNVKAAFLNQVAQQDKQEETEAYIYPHIKEDRFDLYGFATEDELELFKLVLGVSGVGPKTALGIINGGASQLVEAVQEAQLGFFTNVPRVGKKLAQKVIIELKGKLGSMKELNLATLSPKRQDVLDALLGLGFDEASIEAALQSIDIDNLDLAVAIKAAVKIASNQKHGKN